MAKNNFEEDKSYEDEKMTVTMTLEDGEEVTCGIVTILTMDERDYIVLLPLDENGDNEDGEVWIYRYSENPNDPNEEPTIEFISDEDEYERISDVFDEYLDGVEFDEIIAEENQQ